MKKNCKSGKHGLRMAVGGAFMPMRDLNNGNYGVVKDGQNMTAPSAATAPPGWPSGTPYTTVQPSGTLSTTQARPTTTLQPGGGDFRPSANPRPANPRPADTMASQPTLRSATAPTLTPSALESRLTDRLNAGTLTVRGAGMLQGIEDSRRQADMQRYGIDTQANTSKYGVDTQAASNKYNTDTQADTSRYGYDLNHQAQMYNTNAQVGIAGMNNETSKWNNQHSNSTQLDIAGMNQQTALDSMQNQWGMNQYNANASMFNNLANNRSRAYGLRNGGEIHAANGFMPGGYAERNTGTKWLSPYEGTKALAALADMDLKQDYMRAQTEALRSKIETDAEKQVRRTQEQNAADAARTSNAVAYRDANEDRSLRNAMMKQAFDTKMRNDAQDRAMAMQDRGRALRDAQTQRERDSIRYTDELNAAQLASLTTRNRDQDAAAAAWLAKQRAADAQSQALADRQWREDGLRARADQATYRTNELVDADRLLAANRYQANNAAGQLATIRANALQDQDRQTEQARYAQAQALTRAAQQPGMVGRPEDWHGSGYRTHGGADQNAIGNRALMVDGEQAALQSRANQLRDHQAQQSMQLQNDYMAQERAKRDDAYIAQSRANQLRDHQAQQSMQLQNDYMAQERAKRDDAYIAQSRADARHRQIVGDTYALEDRARNYDMLQQANARMNASTAHPWNRNRGYGLRNGGDILQTGIGGVVPGTGKGDKVPAKYEPGEFVVSNDMLDAEPELRDHLRSLREQVLAEKGMTVQEADAKAVGRGRGLRADVGWGYDTEDLNQRRARDFGLTEEEVADTEAKLQAKQARGEAIRNAAMNDDGAAKIAALNQRAAEADARTRADASRGVYRDVDPTMSPELAASREEGRRRDLRSYADAQSAALDAGKSAPALPKSLRDTGNIYKTVDAQGRVTYSGGNVKAGAKFIGGDGEEFTPRGSVEYAKPGTRFAATPNGKGAVFTPVSEDKNQRAADIAQNAVDVAKWKAKEAAEAPLRAKEQERMDMIGEVRGLEQAALSGDNRAAALLPGARNLLSDQQKTDALERSEAAKNAAHIEGIKLQTQGILDAARAKKLAEHENEMIIAEALKKTEGNSEAAVDLLAKAGRGDLSKILSERVTADNDRRTKDYENMISEFKKLGVRDAGTGEEIPGGAEMAAQLLLKRTGGKIIDADKRAKWMREAILEARLLHGMQQKARGRNSSLRTWFAGDDNIPTDLPASSTPKDLGPWDGAWTFGGVEAGDYKYGDHYLPATVGEDAIEHAKTLAKRKAGIK